MTANPTTVVQGTPPRGHRLQLVYPLCAVTLLAMALLSLALGSVVIPFETTFKALLGLGEGSYAQHIILQFRLPKMLTALCVGSALAVSGMLMQTLFRNPLAGPHILGISSGASLGAAIAILAGGLLIANSPLSLALSAWLGAMAMLTIIMAASLRLKRNSTLLILGVLLGAAASSGVSILQYIGNNQALKSFVIWGMGSLANVTGHSLQILFACTLIGIGLTLCCLRGLNVLLLGEAQANALGLPMRQIRLLVFLATSILAGTSTALCGPIGFIGIAVPHLVRKMLGTVRHGPLLAGCLLVGPIAMLLADLIAQLPGSNLTLPLNAVAALLGLPIVMHILLVGDR